MKTKSIILAAAMGTLALIASQAHAALVIITPVDAEADTEFNANFEAVNVINNSGLTGTGITATHATAAGGTVWAGAPGSAATVLPNSIRFDLGDTYTVSDLHIWQYANSGFWAKDITVQFSTDGMAGTYSGSQTILLLEGSTGPVSSQNFSITPVIANAVQFTITSTYDDPEFTLAGLSEVKFSGVAVPEPSSTALLGLSGLALMLRRKRS